MKKSMLSHLAVVVDGVGLLPTPPADRISLAGRLLSLFAGLTHDVFSVTGETTTLSLFSPVLRELLPSLPEESDGALLRQGLEEVRRAATEGDAELKVHGSRETLAPGLTATLFPAFPAGPSSRTVNLFLNYSAREEIAAAARRWIAARHRRELSPEAFATGLSTAGQPDPDFIIFAGGALTPKDFLLWQSSYAEIWHTDRGGLAFSRGDLLRALEEFRKRQRRFGSI